MSSPSSSTSPPSARRYPVRTSNRVVLPAPLWPMRPTIVAGGTTRSTRSTARMPPNRLVSSRHSSVTPRRGRCAGGRATGAAPAPPDSTPAPAPPSSPPRNTARRMSGWSSSPSVCPRNRTCPFSRNVARWHSSMATFTDCSTTMMLVPRACISRTLSTSWATIVGARPSDSSSMHSSLGRVTNAMASDSCCCSPPERSPASWSHRWRSTGNIPSTSSRAAAAAAASFRSIQQASLRFSPTVSVGNTPLPPGMSVRPRRAIFSAGRPVMLSPRNVTLPLVGGSSPQIALSTVDLPAPFVPRSASMSSWATARSIPNRTCSEPYDASRLRQTSIGRCVWAAPASRPEAVISAGRAVPAPMRPSWSMSSSSSTTFRSRRLAQNQASLSRTRSAAWARPPGSTMRISSSPAPVSTSW